MLGSTRGVFPLRADVERRKNILVLSQDFDFPPVKHFLGEPFAVVQSIDVQIRDETQRVSYRHLPLDPGNLNVNIIGAASSPFPNEPINKY